MHFSFYLTKLVKAADDNERLRILEACALEWEKRNGQ